MSIRIFHIQTELSLEDLTSLVATTFQVPRFSERDSANYPGGRYFKGTAQELTFKIAQESDAEWSDFQFWMVVSTTRKNDETDSVDPVFATTCDEIVRKLLCADLGVGRETSHNETDIQREIFQLDTSGNVLCTVEKKPLSKG